MDACGKKEAFQINLKVNDLFGVVIFMLSSSEST